MATAEPKVVQAGGRAADWLKRAPLPKLESLAYSIRDAGSALEEAGYPAGEVSYFGVSEPRDRLGQIKKRLATRRPPRTLVDWTRSDYSDVGYVLKSAVDEPFAQSTTKARAQLAAALQDPEAGSTARAALETLANFDKTLAVLRTSPLPSDSAMAAELNSFADRLEALGMSSTQPIKLAGEARATTRSLQQGSLSVLGFTIPGLAVRVLIPLVALALAIDLALASARLRRFARRALNAEEARSLIKGFPWLFSPAQASRSQLQHKLRAGLIPFMVLAAPVLAIGPLVLSGNGWTRIAGVLFLLAALALEVMALVSLLRAMEAEYDEPPKLPDTGLPGELAREHLTGVGMAFALQLGACVAVLAFFLALVLAPARLLSDDDGLASAREAREELGRAYQQRLLDHSDNYERWCQLGCDVWTEFSFAQASLPADHPASESLAQLAKHPIVLAQMQGTSHTQDLVLESRANLAELDRFDLAQVWEVLNRKSFGPIVKLLGDIGGVHSRYPLPADVLERLPSGVAGTTRSGPTVPFLVPYREWVERGGFADRLAPLPPSSAVEGWFAFMDQMGIETVAGFDRYQQAIEAFNSEIGKVRLRIAGIEVTRQAARDVALVAILLITGLFALRLRQAALYFGANGELRESALVSTPGMLWTESRDRVWSSTVDMLCFGTPVATALVAIAAPTASNDQWVPWMLVAGIAILSFNAARWRRRLVNLRPELPEEVRPSSVETKV